MRQVCLNNQAVADICLKPYTTTTSGPFANQTSYCAAVTDNCNTANACVALNGNGTGVGLSCSTTNAAVPHFKMHSSMGLLIVVSALLAVASASF